MDTGFPKILAIGGDDLGVAVAEGLPGSTLAIARDPASALDLARADAPDVVVVKLAGAGEDGHEFCRRLKADGRLCAVPLLVLAPESSGREGRLRALEAGADEVATTPIDEVELAARVRALVRDRSGRRTPATGPRTELLERLHTETALIHAHRALRALSACTEALIRATDETRLYEDVCRLVVETAGYRLAWVGVPERDEARTVRPAAWAGVEQGYLDVIHVSWTDDRFGRGPAGTAIRERRPVIIRDLVTDPHFEPWREEARKRGYASVLSIPLLAEDGACVGGLNIYAAERDAFDKAEVGFLAELAGNLSYGLRALRDRAALVEAESRLRATSGRLRHLLQSSPSLVYSLRVVDGGLEPGEISENVERMLGFSPAEALVPGWWAGRLHPDDREAALEASARVLAEGRQTKEFRVARRDGRYLWVQDDVRVVRDRDGRAVEVVGAWTDVTERKRVEEALRDSEARFRKAVEEAPFPAMIHAEDGEVVSLSRAWTESSGYAREDIPTIAAWTERAYGERKETVRAEIAALHDLPSRTSEGEYRIRCSDGSERVWEFSSVGLGRLPDGRRIAMSMAFDVTDRIRAEEERETLEAQFLQSQKMESIGRLAGGVAHDFNNMLSVILGHADMALTRLEPGDPLRLPLEEIARAADRSVNLTRQLLAFARKQTVAPRVLDLNEKVEGTLALLRRLIGEDIDLAWLPGADPAAVLIDPGQVDQVLANLCVNARDAIVGVGKIVIETATVVVDEDYCAEHAGFSPGEFVVLAVSDDGVGMDAETQRNIFEPFFTTKPMGEGTGLGLATVYGIVRQNGGFVNVYSEPGRGTTFKLYLPRHGAAVERPAREIAVPAERGGDETILLVEDEPAILSLATEMLESLGYAVLPVATPSAAIRLAGEHPGKVHLLITDVVMPEMNGRELAATLESLHPEIRQLFMSGYTANVIAEGGVLAEGVHFMEKPFSLRDLASKVREALADD